MDKKEAADFLKNLPADEAEVFEKVVRQLNTLPNEKPLKFEGSIASLLGNCLISYSTCPKPFVAVYPEDLLCGFWEPSPKDPTRKGVLMWREPTTGNYTIFITESRAHALEAIKTLYWMERERQEELSEKIKRWGLFPRANKAAVRIEGPVATLLCHASIYKRLESIGTEYRAQMN